MTKKRMIVELAIGLLGLLTIVFVSGSEAKDKGYKAWQKAQQQEFKDFKNAADRRFYDFLRQQWQEFQVSKGAPEDPTPKPVTIPTAPEPQKPKPRKPEPVRPQPEQPQPPKPAPKKPAPLAPTRPEAEKPLPVKPSIAKPTPEPPSPKPGPPPQPEEVPEAAPLPPGKKTSLTFLGKDYVFPDIKGVSRLSLTGRDQEAVAVFWKDFASAGAEPLLARLNDYRKADQRKGRMNDWIYLGLVKALGDRLYDDANLSRLFCWAVMVKSGYDVRIGFNGNTLYLLYPATDKLFGVPFFSLDQKRYYLYEGRAGRLATYKADYLPTQKELDLFLNKRPALKDKPRRRTLSFSYRGRSYEVPATYDSLLIELMDTLPQFALEKYVTADPGQMIRPDLVATLQKAMRGLPDDPAVQVNFLLAFVQQAFAYKTDDEQFGREKYFFSEEILHYPYSDCEDRTILFTGLLRALTDLDVAVLDYPGHVAAAVHIPGEGYGDYLLLDGKKFYVADPTYINAKLGMTMPNFRNVRPEIIRVGRR